jgi:hypothetical protein
MVIIGTVRSKGGSGAKRAAFAVLVISLARRLKDAQIWHGLKDEKHYTNPAGS